MPFKIVAEQTVFKLTTAANGLPVGEYELWGGIPYLLCCPCCGMLHELKRDSQPGQTFKPNCVVRVTHPKTYAAWVKAHPAVSAHTEIVLKLRGVEVNFPQETIISTPAEPHKRAA